MDVDVEVNVVEMVEAVVVKLVVLWPLVSLDLDF